MIGGDNQGLAVFVEEHTEFMAIDHELPTRRTRETTLSDPKLSKASKKYPKKQEKLRLESWIKTRMKQNDVQLIFQK